MSQSKQLTYAEVDLSYQKLIHQATSAHNLLIEELGQKTTLLTNQVQVLQTEIEKLRKDNDELRSKEAKK